MKRVSVNVSCCKTCNKFPSKRASWLFCPLLFVLRWMTWLKPLKWLIQCPSVHLSSFLTPFGPWTTLVAGDKCLFEAAQTDGRMDEGGGTLRGKHRGLKLQCWSAPRVFNPPFIFHLHNPSTSFHQPHCDRQTGGFKGKRLIRGATGSKTVLRPQRQNYSQIPPVNIIIFWLGLFCK